MIRLLLACLVLLPGVATAAGGNADEVRRCVLDSRPKTRTVETLRLTATDRIGSSNVRRALVYSGRLRDGPRAVYVRFLSPSELVGSEVLLVEQEKGLANVFVSLDARGLLRLGGARRSGGLFGTDFSPEDLARLYGLNRPGESRLLDAPEPGLQALETRPGDPETSAYRRVVSHVESERCVVVRASLYDQQDAHRKELTIDPDRIDAVGDGWLPRDVRMRDLRDESETHLVVETIEFGDRVRELPFRASDLPAAGPTVDVTGGKPKLPDR